MPLFHRSTCDYSRADWGDFRYELRDVPWEDILNSDRAAAEFCECVQFRINVYIPHVKYHVKPHSSPLFSAAAVTARRSHLFRLY